MYHVHCSASTQLQSRHYNRYHGQRTLTLALGDYCMELCVPVPLRDLVYFLWVAGAPTPTDAHLALTAAEPVNGASMHAC
jgi:hypothetical protein